MYVSAQLELGAKVVNLPQAFKDSVQTSTKCPRSTISAGLVACHWEQNCSISFPGNSDYNKQAGKVLYTNT